MRSHTSTRSRTRAHHYAVAVALALALAAIALAACRSSVSTDQATTPSSTGSTAVASTPGIVIGPGAQSTYTVQRQPDPGTCHYRTTGGDTLPDPACTPGAVNPQVTQATIGSTICRSGWTSTIRPPSSITGAEKRGSAAAYNYVGSFSTGEYDHLIPLELGGDPNDPANLWVQPNDRPGATSTYNSKDTLESVLRRLVCSGTLTLAAAQSAIATDWVTAFHNYAG